MAVIEGDQQTSLDADRIRETGVNAIQVNTGKGCHLDARMVGAAFERLDVHAAGHAGNARHSGYDVHDIQGESGRYHRQNTPACNSESRVSDAGPGALLLIENVGNLVCPAMWDLGEAAKVVILSVTEGDDKPLKYPDMFAAAKLMVLNKIDLLPYVDFDVDRCIAAARRVNPAIEVLSLSATTGEGIDSWIDWLLQPSCAHDDVPA
jgi:hydrogenase nickel incorporation protein HypB